MTKVFALVAVAGAASLAAGQISAQDISSGGPLAGSIMTSGNTNANPAAWAYFRFQATAGDMVSIEINRVTGDLDPVSRCWEGDANGFAFSTFTDIFSSGAGFPSVGTGDDNDPPAVPGPWGDPHYTVSILNSGWYTFAVSSYASNPMPPGGYQLTAEVSGNRVPAPGAAALLGLGGLAISRRRR